MDAGDARALTRSLSTILSLKLKLWSTLRTSSVRVLPESSTGSGSVGPRIVVQMGAKYGAST